MDRKYTILIVDDSPTVLQMIRTYLEKEGYNYDVKTTDSPEEAMKILEIYVIDLVICDIVLKSLNGTTGYDLLRDIKKKPLLKHIPAILMSGQRDEKSARPAAEYLGAVDFLQKPFEMYELIEKVKQILGN